MLDEAQNIKDAESSRFRAIGNLRSKRRLLLTGEPPSRALLACSRVSSAVCAESWRCRCFCVRACAPWRWSSAVCGGEAMLPNTKKAELLVRACVRVCVSE